MVASPEPKFLFGAIFTRRLAASRARVSPSTSIGTRSCVGPASISTSNSIYLILSLDCHFHQRQLQLPSRQLHFYNSAASTKSYAFTIRSLGIIYLGFRDCRIILIILITTKCRLSGSCTSSSIQRALDQITTPLSPSQVTRALKHSCTSLQQWLSRSGCRGCGLHGLGCRMQKRELRRRACKVRP